MMKAKVFQSGNSQAVRIPKEAHTEQKEFVLHKVGDAMILVPENDPWFGIRAGMGSIPDDFLEDRKQPTWEDVEKREDF